MKTNRRTTKATCDRQIATHLVGSVFHRPCGRTATSHDTITGKDYCGQHAKMVRPSGFGMELVSR